MFLKSLDIIPLIGSDGAHNFDHLKLIHAGLFKRSVNITQHRLDLNFPMKVLKGIIALDIVNSIDRGSLYKIPFDFNQFICSCFIRSTVYISLC